MRLVRHLDEYSGDGRGLALTIGNFDGVHAGHRAVVAELRERAARAGLATAAMCFEPQPLEFLSRDGIPARLSRFRDKFLGLRELGVDYLFCLRFDGAFAAISPADFISGILAARLRVRLLVVGDDFRFGRMGDGGYDLLAEAGRKYGFSVYRTPSFTLGGERVSSTAVRRLLSAGRLGEASAMLGEYFHIRGRVCRGNRIGTSIGYPTANINLNRRVIPLFGTYAVTALLPDGRELPGLANVGSRPTVSGSCPLLEVHVLDYSGDLYGREIKVSFLKKLRDEEKFPSVEALRAQIRKDEAAARAFFGSAPGGPASLPGAPGPG